MKSLLLAPLVVASVLVPAYPAVADNSGNQPPGPPAASYSNEEQGGPRPVFHTYVEHCQAYNNGAGTVVFTAGRVGHPGRVNNNCRGE
jgi:hypothetical protein